MHEGYNNIEFENPAFEVVIRPCHTPGLTLGENMLDKIRETIETSGRKGEDGKIRIGEQYFTDWGVNKGQVEANFENVIVVPDTAVRA